MSAPAMTRGDLSPIEERRARVRRGHLYEWLAAALLLLKGYWPLGRRVRSRLGEIDLVAVRGRRLVFVEVKGRPTLEEAKAAVTSRQLLRVARAAEAWVARHPRYADHEIRLDAVLVAPWRWPRHCVMC